MLLATNTANLMKPDSARGTVDMLRDAGFTAIDFSFFDPVWYGDALEDSFFTELRGYAEGTGIRFHQAHAPYHSSFADAEQTARRFREIVCAMGRAALLGAGILVVHPVQHLDYAEAGVPERLFEENMEFYGRLIPYAKEFGIRIAVENMWQYHPWPRIGHSVCSTPQEMKRYLDTLDSPWVTGCLDVGHASLVGQPPEEFAAALGAERLGALHIHDVSATEDSHTIPYQGVIDWEKLMGALRSVGYAGALNFECTHFFRRLPPELYPDALGLLARTGRVLMGKMREE